MITKVIRFDKLLVCTNELNQKIFDISPVWCEYYDPSELDYLQKIGVPKYWLVKNLIKPVESTGSHPYYSVLGEKNYPNHEFLFVKVSIFHEEEFLTLGYLNVVNYLITTLTVFSPSTEYDFTINPLFSDENFDAWKKFIKEFKLKNSKPGVLSYVASSNLDGKIKEHDKFCFPLK